MDYIEMNGFIGHRDWIIRFLLSEQQLVQIQQNLDSISSKAGCRKCIYEHPTNGGWIWKEMMSASYWFLLGEPVWGHTHVSFRFRQLRFLSLRKALLFFLAEGIATNENCGRRKKHEECFWPVHIRRKTDGCWCWWNTEVRRRVRAVTKVARKFEPWAKTDTDIRCKE